MFKKLRTVIYRVNDLVAAKEWYTLAIGAQPYFDEPFYVGFDINGYELGLDPNAPDMGAGNHTVSYWAVDDVEAAALKLTGLGARLMQPKTNVGGTIHVAIIEDPFGNCLGLIEGA
jgi:predicted enzyme related to lactoylglutathione lyase